jgi:hypothetical protein
MARTTIRTGTKVFTHSLPPMRRVGDRDSALLSMVDGKRAAHVGCTDAPFTEEKLSNGVLLHEQVLRCASAALGVDVDVAGLRLLEQRLGGEYSSLDLSSEQPDLSAIIAFRPDVLLATDVIEHVGDAQMFLTNLALAAAATSASVVLSTPNALSARAFLCTAFGLELIHPDHVAIYSPRTLRALGGRAGLQADRWHTYNIRTGESISRSMFDRTVDVLSRIRTGYADGLIVTFTAVGPSASV